MSAAGTWRMLVINPGSTSTKIALFENENCLWEQSRFHDAPVLLQFPDINSQLPFRRQVILDLLREHDTDPASVDVWLARGGNPYAMEGGTYRVTDLLVEDTRAVKGGTQHPSNLGVLLAQSLHEEYGGEMFMTDPPNTDEFEPVARLTGIAGVYRVSSFHALNQKGMARAYAASVGKRYEDMHLIVCHIDGGITIGAHKLGRVVDCTVGAGGEGPFTPTRIGTVPAGAYSAYAQGKSFEELFALCSRSGGLVSHFGTSDAGAVHEMAEEGNKKASLVWEAMGYQICKCIGEMATVLEGKTEAILLGGGLLRFADLREQLQRRCSWIAPMVFYDVEFEHSAMVGGALRVLRGEEQAKLYTGRPVWSGFDWD